jgi:two-component system LytT family response regulator
MKDKIRAIIVDDESHARAAITGIISEHFQQIEVLDQAKDLPNAVKLIHKLNPDLVFLDVEMPGHSGLELLDFFNENEVCFDIIFVTAYSEYAIHAFKLAAVDYLLKPLKLADMEKAIDLYYKRNRSKSYQSKYEKLQVLKSNINNHKEKRIVLPTNEGLIIENIENIVYFKADGSYVQITFANKSKILLTRKLLDFEYLEEQGDFLRVHRSYMVNLKHVKKIMKGDSSLILSTGDEISITNEKRQQLVHLLNC